MSDLPVGGPGQGPEGPCRSEPSTDARAVQRLHNALRGTQVQHGEVVSQVLDAANLVLQVVVAELRVRPDGRTRHQLGVVMLSRVNAQALTVTLSVRVAGVIGDLHSLVGLLAGHVPDVVLHLVQAVQVGLVDDAGHLERLLQAHLDAVRVEDAHDAVVVQVEDAHDEIQS